MEPLQLANVQHVWDLSPSFQNWNNFHTTVLKKKSNIFYNLNYPTYYLLQALFWWRMHGFIFTVFISFILFKTKGDWYYGKKIFFNLIVDLEHKVVQTLENWSDMISYPQQNTMISLLWFLLNILVGIKV